MAKPISLDLPPRDPRIELLAMLEQAPLNHAEALLDSYRLLQALHDSKVLVTLRGALGAGDKLIETVTEGLDSEAAIRTMRNLMILGKIMGSIDPQVLDGVAKAVNQTLGNASQHSKRPPGLFSIMMHFTSANLRRSLALLNGFLEALGKALSQPKSDHPKLEKHI